MRPLLAVSIGLAGVETALSAAIVAVAARRWNRLDWGARWIAIGNAISLAFYAITIPMVLTDHSTRLINEAPTLLVTMAELTGFALWLARPNQRRIGLVAVPVFAVLWSIGQVIQGTSAEFSSVSIPIRGAMVTALAGATLITRVQATMERWTSEIWFWAAAGYMLTAGTEVLFDPTAQLLQTSRPDLALGIHVLRLALNLVAYGLVLRGYVLATTTRREIATPSNEPITTMTVGSSGSWAIRKQ